MLVGERLISAVALLHFHFLDGAEPHDTPCPKHLWDLIKDKHTVAHPNPREDVGLTPPRCGRNRLEFLWRGGSSHFRLGRRSEEHT